MDFAQTQLAQELEDHIRRVIQYPQPNTLNVTDMRSGLMAALERYIDSRIYVTLEQRRKEQPHS